MEPIAGSMIQASYGHTHQLSGKITDTLINLSTPIGYGILACALTICRLSQPTQDMGAVREIKFVQDLTDWLEAYWGDDTEKVAN